MATTGRKKPQISIAFTEVQRRWLEEQAQARGGISLADVVRRVIDERMAGPIGANQHGEWLAYDKQEVTSG